MAVNAGASSAILSHERRRHPQYRHQLGRVRTAAWALTNLLAPPDAVLPQLATRRAHAAVRAGALDVLCPMLLLLGGGSAQSLTAISGLDGRSGVSTSSSSGKSNNSSSSSSSSDIGMDRAEVAMVSFDEEHEDIFVEAAWLLSALLPRCSSASASGTVSSAADDGEASGVQSDARPLASANGATFAGGSETRSALLRRLVVSGAIDAVVTRLVSVCSSSLPGAAHVSGSISNGNGNAPTAFVFRGANASIFEGHGSASSASVTEPSTSIILPCVRLLAQALLAELESDEPASDAAGDAGVVMDAASRSSPEVFALCSQPSGAVSGIALRSPVLLRALCGCLQHSNRYTSFYTQRMAGLIFKLACLIVFTSVLFCSLSVLCEKKRRFSSRISAAHQRRTCSHFSALLSS